MWRLLASFFGNPKGETERESTLTRETYTLREGKSVKTDAAFNAWTSGSLKHMVAALNTKTNPIDRHFLLMGIVDATYKRRKDDPDMLALCLEIAEKHIAEFATLAPPLRRDMGGTLPRVSTFQNYATVLVEQGRFDEAIAVCEKALSFDLHDGTASGFEGRVERIKKQKTKAAMTTPPPAE